MASLKPSQSGYIIQPVSKRGFMQLANSFISTTLCDFFFPSFASAALARSSHNVVLMNELSKCMKQRPSLGSRKRSADHYAVRSLVRPVSKKQDKTKKPKSPQKPSENGTDQDSSNGAGNLCANELRDLAQQQKNTTRQLGKILRRCPQHNTV